MPNATQNQTGNLSPKVAQNRHPVFALLQDTWQQLADVREGTGGFITGEYLRAHPREYLDHTVQVTSTDNGVSVTTNRQNPRPRQPSAKLLARRKLARYENVASAILTANKAVLFRDSPTRRVGDASKEGRAPSEIEKWWQDVDGHNAHIDDAMNVWWDLAATFGHMGALMCRDENEGAKTAADDHPPYVRIYTPLDIINWLTDDAGNIISVKLLEAVPASGYDTAPSFAIRIVDETNVTVYDHKTGNRVSETAHNFGCLPFAFLFAKRRPLLADVGESVLGDPRTYIDLFNLTSEVRELLRSQTFSFINLPLGTGQDAMSVEEAQTMMGKQTGTMNVLFSGEAAQILTGDPTNVTSYHEEIARLRREIYRETGVQWESDSKDAEALGSLSLKREEMTTRIAMYADECQRFEYTLVELFYRALYGPAQYERKLEDDKVVIQYPDRFDHQPFEDLLKEAQSAQSLGMPSEVMKTIRKQLLVKFEGISNLPPEELKKLTSAIDAAEDDPTPMDRLREKVKSQAFGKGAAA